MARAVAAEAAAILRHLADGYTYWLHGSTSRQRMAVERLEAAGKVVRRYAWSRSRGRWEPVCYAADDPRADGMPTEAPAEPECPFTYAAR